MPARGAALLLGLALFALGIVFLYESHLGLSPWDVLNQGLAKHTPLSFGTANIAIGSALLVVAMFLGARIGVGTAANAVLVGAFVDLYLRVGALAHLGHEPLGVRAALLVAGIPLIGVATALYVGAGFGAGPRDSLMIVLTQRTGARLGVVRGLLEASATVAGFILGGTVGIGTLAFVLSIGPVVEASFALLGRSPLAQGEQLSDTFAGV